MASLTDRAVADIKAMIVAGTLRPGDRLPREQDLAADLGLSRATLREAVAALSAMNVIDVRHGDGMFVTSLAPEVLLEPLTFVVELHRDESILHFLQLRSFVEPECVAAAAATIGPAQVEALRGLVEQGEELSRAQPVDHVAMMDNDLAFHALLNAESGNPVASAIMAATAQITMAARVRRSENQRGAELDTAADHRRIFEAVCAGDSRRAALRAAAHIGRTEDWFASLQGSATLGRRATAAAG